LKSFYEIKKLKTFKLGNFEIALCFMAQAKAIKEA